ncbi:MAG: ATP-binding protein [Chloroflexales bacterium]
MAYQLLTLVDWALIAGSLFNTITLLWLGLTVLLSAERRSWGTWLAGGGLLFGGLFFVGHTAVVGRVIGAFDDEMSLYWRLGWLVLIIAPYLWYAVMAWYCGGLRARPERLRLAGVGALGVLAVLLALFVDPLPSYADLAQPVFGPTSILSGTTLTRMIYPGFAALCIVLALLSLRAPTASGRFMGDLARQRARPWLLAASAMLLAIALAIGAASVWFLDQARAGLFPGLTARGVGMIIGFDFLVGMMIAVTVVLIGQAVVSYEIFTGAALPRGELARQWRRTLILGGIYALAVGWSLSGAGIPEKPIYHLLIATVLMTTFLALVGWRSARESTSGLSRLRPFIASQNLYDRLLGPAGPGDDEPEAAFHALCGELLGAQMAYLLPLGSLADLAGPALAHPAAATPPDAAALIAAIQAAPPPAHGQPPPLCLPIDPARHGGAGWAVPLRNRRGLIGLLLLGAKSDAGVYTQEEIEVARAAGERLIDARAATEMARRLAALQRRRIAESQVIDRRTRRVLHDEVLPQIHATLLQIADGRLQIDPQSDSGSNRQSAITNLQSVHRQISDLLHDLPPVVSLDLARLGALGALRRTVESDLGAAFDTVCWEVPVEAEAAARQLDPLGAEALYYAAREAVRNAARHGRGDTPSRPLTLTVRASSAAPQGGQPQLTITVADDGVGMGAAPTRSDGGHGMAIHSTLLAIMGGTLSVSSAPRQATAITISMPIPAAH